MRLGTYHRFTVLRALSLLPNGNSTLDVGCYDGYLLKQSPGEIKIGVDICPVPTEDLSKDGIKFVQADITKPLQGLNVTFDEIYAMDVLEHIHYDNLAVKNLFEMLKPDGRLIISVPHSYFKSPVPFLPLSVWNKKVGHIRNGYLPEQIHQLIPSHATITTIHWNSPLFRRFYIMLRLLNPVVPRLVQKILDKITDYDNKHREGQNGWLYFIIKKSMDVI